jgi:hypothetical protein
MAPRREVPSSGSVALCLIVAATIGYPLLFVALALAGGASGAAAGALLLVPVTGAVIALVVGGLTARVVRGSVSAGCALVLVLSLLAASWWANARRVTFEPTPGADAVAYALASANAVAAGAAIHLTQLARRRRGSRS